MASNLVIAFICGIGALLGVSSYLFMPMIGPGAMIFPNGVFELFLISSIFLPIIILIFVNKSITKYLALVWLLIALFQEVSIILPFLNYLPNFFTNFWISPYMPIHVINAVQIIMAVYLFALLKSEGKKQP
jgi:hypothetical protein